MTMSATTALLLHKNADVAVTSVSRRPRAIVVVLGWTGATVAQLSRYTTLYHALDCSTISTAAPLLLVKDTTLLEEWAVSISREAARLVRMAHMSEMGMANVPILIHVFGTGGIRLAEELSQCLEQYVGTSPCLERSVSYPSRSSSRGMSMRKLNASTRSLFTNDTEPLSDDDDEDTEDDSSESETTSIEDCSPHNISDSTPTLRRRPTLSTSLPKEESTCHRGPSVSRVDLERHGLNLNQAYNPDDRACRRDLQLCASHLHTVLWDDMGPCRRNEMSWWTWLLMALLYAWQLLKQWLLFGSTNVANNNKAASEKHDGTPSLTLTRKHAFVYNSSNASRSHELMRRVNSSLDIDISGRCQLQGRGLGFSQKRYANEDYAAFVTKIVDTVAPTKDEDDGWESDDDSQTS